MSINTTIEFILSGVRLKDTTMVINNYIEKNYIHNVTCAKCNDNSVKINANISKGNIYTNYILAKQFKDFIINVFSVFCNNVKIQDLLIDPKPNDVDCSVAVAFSSEQISEDEFNSFAQKLCNKSSDELFNELLKNLTNSEDTSNYAINYDKFDKFRNLFAVFDNLAPKKSENGPIDYNDQGLKQKFCHQINLIYNDKFKCRFHKAINLFIKSNLENDRANRNYSTELDSAFQNLNREEVINLSVAEKTLRCIQQIRNNLNHGNFTSVTVELVAWAYELLIPLVQYYLINS